MSDRTSFGAFLTYLCERESLDISAVREAADASEWSRLSRGETPSPALLRRVAPTLGFHAADLFVIAGVTMPPDLAPVDPAAGRLVPALLASARAVTEEGRARVHRAIADMPQRPHLPPDPRTAVDDRRSTGPGALLMRMARNRNLGWTAMAKVVLLMTGRYWSPATYGSIAYGRVALAPDLVVDFATVLGLHAEDLAWLTGVSLGGPSAAPDPANAGLAELAWAARRLTAAQLAEVDQMVRIGLFTGSPRRN
jgi:hypothetical protein